METGKAIYKLLKDSVAVGAICGDRIYPELAQQDAVTPFIVYTVTDTTPSGTKNATSKLDTARVELYCIADDYETGMSLGIEVRSALDRQSGTINGVEVQSIDFDTSDIQFEPDQRFYILEQTYDVRIQRTGTAQVVTQFPGNTFTVEEVDGDPSGAVNKLVVSNGTLTIAGNTATIDTGGGADVQYHDRYSTEAETERSGATATLEVYYTARPDGDGYAESEVSDVGETDTINRTLYYSDKFQADPDTAGDWTEYTTQPADNATFATAKAALLAGLNETDATAETRGTLPLSLKMVRTTTAAVVELLLDTYTGASAAYSVRKLRSAHTGACMRIRRASDDAETDIGFDLNGDLDTAAIASHCGASAGYCVTWVDQSGNGNNVTQSTSGSQPQIYNGTAVITENGKPAIYFADYNYQLANTSGTWGGTNVLTCDFVNVHTLVSGSGLGGGASSEKHFLFWYDGAFQVAQIYLGTYYLGWSRTTTGPSADTNQHLWYGIASNGTGQIRVDGTASTAGTLNTSRYFSGEFAFNGRPGAPTTERGVEQYQQEFIQWDVNQSAGNRTGIETDIDTYFSIT